MKANLVGFVGWWLVAGAWIGMSLTHALAHIRGDQVGIIPHDKAAAFLGGGAVFLLAIGIAYLAAYLKEPR